MEIKFNHDAETTMEAMGSAQTPEVLSDKMGNVCTQFMEGNNMKMSVLCELVVKNMTDAEMAFICATYLYKSMERALEAMIMDNELFKGEE